MRLASDPRLLEDFAAAVDDAWLIFTAAFVFCKQKKNLSLFLLRLF